MTLPYRVALPPQTTAFIVPYPAPEAEIPAQDHWDLRHGHRHVPVPFLPALASVEPSKALPVAQEHHPCLLAWVSHWRNMSPFSLCQASPLGVMGMALAASFRDRDGDTEKHKQKGSERGKARTRANSSQASSGEPHPAHSWVGSGKRGRSRPFLACLAG